MICITISFFRSFKLLTYGIEHFNVQMSENLIKIGWNFLLLLHWHLTDLRGMREGSKSIFFCAAWFLLRTTVSCVLLCKMKNWGVLRSNETEKMKMHKLKKRVFFLEGISGRWSEIGFQFTWKYDKSFTDFQGGYCFLSTVLMTK